MNDELQPEFQTGDRLLLTVREPGSCWNASADYPGNYMPTDYVGEVEMAYTGSSEASHLRVRWHLPAAYGYDTLKGAVSTLINVGDKVWLEARKRPRNVVATIQKIPEEQYQQLLREAEKA